MSAVEKESFENIKLQMAELGRNAKKSAHILANIPSQNKDDALGYSANLLRENIDKLIAANEQDMEFAKQKNVSIAMLDRLMLDEGRIEAMATSIEEIIELNDPVGSELARWQRPNGLDIARVAVPLGVIGIIFEARPNVTADAGALCLKSGNAVILRAGSESFMSASAITECLQQGLAQAGLPETAIQLVPTRDREAVGEMLKMSDYIDVIIPRGGKGLIERIVNESKIPTLQHLDGNCHTYIHKDADPDKALKIILNAKMRRPGICGATETLVIDEEIATDLLPKIADALEGCELRGDEIAVAVDDRIKPATANDWDTEYLDAILAIKTVKNIDEAIDFIENHSSSHTESIVTEDKESAEKFLSQISSAIVMHNTSTQFADGGEFGMGAEIGIATGKLHARGPVGVKQLTTFKYIVRGDGQVRPK